MNEKMRDMTMELNQSDLKYLELLSTKYRTIEEASTEIINLTAIQNLPKGTEHFISDIHGEYDAFQHILKNASGAIKLKIDETFGGYVSVEERRALATLIYYPEEKLELLKKQGFDMGPFYKKTLQRLITLLSAVTVKFTRAYVRKRMPQEYAYIIEELLYGDTVAHGKENYKETLIDTIIETRVADDFIIQMSGMISVLAVHRLHVLGDIFDRGDNADRVLNALKEHHRVDIQWGNHDILWMGAAAGNTACIANVIRICTRYDNLHTLEVGYGISIRPLLTFALATYENDPCPNFKAIVSTQDALAQSDLKTLAKISKAIAVIQFKLEGQLIARHPHYEMDEMPLLHKVDYKNKTVEIDGKIYQMNENDFPTIDPEDPYKLTEMEEAVVERLRDAFLESELLQDHVRFLFSTGSIYKCYNNNLLFHGCMPLNEDGTFMEIMTDDGPMKGKEWFDYAERLVRHGYFANDDEEDKQRGVDFFWYLWCGYKSPLFGKKKITTFERLFIDDKDTWKEPKNPYYTLMDDEKIVMDIVEEFGL
ncbi:MAG: fructose-1,6-bisphosphatase, partial [Firmicutes bacterium]|nr:fructose-1,6-bisphosphatase [Bacillota bacterium]